ncbi:hypothetical protein [Methylobacterium persicinum]|uniref:Uncharacterized protein n=1 Tax=Methylobacterium persicinum TaxID=374426 RepID=A0ABU0HKH9_9HYPH|nr:hypothetical protein [Methylobacterium persicinum]MDQ0442818.1 hypothetical protein [Methylobacterium persicinum]GJE36938.1 hypothetical protein KHHGKMAE_0993 [Methylobacterium persicinum]
MRSILLGAAALTLIAGSAFAQGGSPYNTSGAQAGGPRGGMERAAQGAEMEAPAPGARPMMRKRSMHKRMHHRKMHHRRMHHSM